jgi:hypothetical protein
MGKGSVAEVRDAHTGERKKKARDKKAAAERGKARKAAKKR